MQQHLKISFVISLVFSLNNIACAQTKYEIYTNKNIVWAGIADIDIVIDDKEVKDWKYYNLIGLGGDLKQISTNLKVNKKSLNEIIITQANKFLWYEYDSLKYKKEHPIYSLYYPEDNGDAARKLPTVEFDVFRLRCFIYYDRIELNFKIQPIAVQVLNSEDDTGLAAIAFEEIGWLPVKKSTKSINIDATNITFAKRFYRDINFETVAVFKQEWTIEEVINNMMTDIRAKSPTIKLFSPDINAPKLLTENEIDKLGTDEVYIFDVETSDERPIAMPWLDSDYKGVRLVLDWIWNDDKKALSINQQGFSPLCIKRDDDDEALELLPVFLREVR